MNRKRAALLGVGVVLVGIQVVPVDRSNPPVTGEISAPAEVRSVLERSCYDCHSNETAWPWYGYVAPASWLLARHVREAREHVNFSEWNDLGLDDRAEAFEEIAEEVDEAKMPLPSYLPLHPEARLTDAERYLLVDWAMGGAGERALPID